MVDLSKLKVGDTVKTRKGLKYKVYSIRPSKVEGMYVLVNKNLYTREGFLLRNKTPYYADIVEIIPNENEVKKSDSQINAERARELFDYDSQTGKLFWKVSRGVAKVGSEAGCIGRDGYWKLRIDRKTYVAHRVIWLMTYGEFPAPGMQINHIDENKLNNRLENLEVVTPSQNTNHGTRTQRATEAINKSLFCTTNGVLYKSQTLAARELKISQSSISQYLKGKLNHVGGYKFEESREEIEE